MSGYVCPGCRSHKMADECWHTPRMWALAEALAGGLPGGPALWGTPIERAWAFIDDAESLDGDVGEPPYAVAMFHPSGSTNYTTIGLVNARYLFAVDEETDFLGDVQDEHGLARLVIQEPNRTGGAVMPEFHSASDAPTLTTVAELNRLTAASVVLTADGFRYVKRVDGTWSCPGVTETANPRYLLDPERWELTGGAPGVRLLYSPHPGTWIESTDQGAGDG